MSIEVPQLSITVLNYNYGHFLPTCLDSICRQTLTNFEVIVINDRSTDSSVDVIGRYLDDPRVRMIDHEVNRGFTYSLIEGVEQSVGQYITVVSADDWIVADDALERQVRLLDEHPSAGFAITAFGYWIDEDRLEGVHQPIAQDGCVSGREMASALLLGSDIHHSGTVIRRSTYDQVGGYDPTFRYAIDTDMWLRLCAVADVAVDPEHRHAYRQHGENMTTKLPTISASIEEKLRTINHYCAASGASRSERRAFDRVALTEWVRLYSAERSNLRMAWRAQSAAIRLRPVAAIANPRFVQLSARTLLGARIYGLVRARVRSLLRRRPR